MSAKERLDSYDREWRRYVRERGNATRSADYNELLVPDSLRADFKAGLEALIIREVEAMHVRHRARLVRDAIAEARATLEELEAPEPPAPEPAEFPAWPEEPKEGEA